MAPSALFQPKVRVAHGTRKTGRCPAAPGLGMALNPRRAVVLLEIIISIAILALGMVAIGGQIRQALRAAQRADRLARGVMLAESIVTELDSGLIFPEREQEGDFYMLGFGAQYDGWAWRLLIDESPYLGRNDRDQGMFLVSVEVYYGDLELTGDDLDAKERVYSVYTLRPKPSSVNLVEDLGLDPEDLEALSALLPESLGLDLTGPLDPAMLAGLDFGLLADILPNLPPELLNLLGASGGSLSDLADRLGVGGAGGSSASTDLDDLTPEQQEELERLLSEGGDPLELVQRLEQMTAGRGGSGGGRRR